jgi:hypothetical protein
MRLRDQFIGTLNLFAAAPEGLDPAVALAARVLVDVATTRGRTVAGGSEQPGDHRAG